MIPIRPLMQFILLLSLQVVVNQTLAVTADSNPSTSNAGSDLLNGLLEELDGKLPELAEPNLPKTFQPKNDQPTPGWLPKASDIERNINRQMGGEDVGKRESPLAPIARRMGLAANLIDSDQNKDPPRPVQEQVVSELEKLIEQLEKQCNSSSSSSQCTNPQQQASKRSQPKPSDGSKPSDSQKSASAKQSQSQSAAQTSTTRMGSASGSDAEMETNEQLMKAAWGHLPARLREQMIQSSSEEFLPEYREELKEYFKRLAEREAEENSE